MTRTVLALALLVTPLTVGSAVAQHVFPAGGGAASSSGFSAETTLGDPVVGQTAGGSVSASAGFRSSLPTNAPFGVLPPANAVAGADATVTALLQDDIQVISATLNYRAGGAGAFRQAAMALTDAGTGTWSASIPGTDLGVEGIQYFVEASDGVNSSSIPPTAPVAGLQNLPVAITDHPAFSLQATTFELAGAPLTPENADPLAVFDELGGFNAQVWRYGTFDPIAGSYREAANAAPAAPGQGFWVIAASATSIDVSGTTADLGTNFLLNLQPGFNQIANPFAFAVDFDDLTLPAGADPNLIGWNGVAYVNGVQTLAPGTGYWIFHGGTSAATLEIPPLGSGIARGAPAAAPGAPPLDEEDAWSFSVVARAGECADTDNRFGVRADATGDRDEFDFADAPAPPAGFVVASLLDGEGRRLLTDWREGSEDGLTWTLRMDTDRAGENYRVDLEPQGAFPEGWMLLAWPEDGGEAIDVTEGGTLAGAVTSTATSRRWVLAAGTSAFVGATGEDLQATVLASLPTAFSFSRPFPNPARASAGTSFEFRVPRSASANAAIFDVTGRRVATLMQGTVEAGTHTIRWDGRDLRGRRVASGVYFLRVRADDFAHRDKVVVLE